MILTCEEHDGLFAYEARSYNERCPTCKKLDDLESQIKELQQRVDSLESENLDD